MTAMPWSNTVDVVTVPGSAIRAMLEHSVSQYDANDPDPGGRFLQVSGIRVNYDVTADVGSRVLNVAVRDDDTRGTFQPLDEGKHYRVAVLSFMVKGGDGYKMIPETLIEHRNSGSLDNDLIVSYLKRESPLTAQPDAGRIFFGSSSSKSNSNCSLDVFVLVVVGLFALQRSQ